MGHRVKGLGEIQYADGHFVHVVQSWQQVMCRRKELGFTSYTFTKLVLVGRQGILCVQMVLDVAAKNMFQ